MFIWVSSLIKPLKLIKNYIDDIKNDKESELHIQREDEIGVLSSSLIEMKEEIDRQNEIKEEMIHNISHDLKTPLTSIINYIDLLKRENIQPETAMDYVNILDKKSQRLKVLIEDLFECYFRKYRSVRKESKKFTIFKSIRLHKWTNWR